jgi:hypothetical protein
MPAKPVPQANGGGLLGLRIDQTVVGVGRNTPEALPPHIPSFWARAQPMSLLVDGLYTRKQERERRWRSHPATFVLSGLSTFYADPMVRRREWRAVNVLSYGFIVPGLRLRDRGVLDQPANRFARVMASMHSDSLPP